MFVEVHTYSGLASGCGSFFSLPTTIKQGKDKSKKDHLKKHFFDHDYNDKRDIVFADNSFELEKKNEQFLHYTRS